MRLYKFTKLKLKINLRIYEYRENTGQSKFDKYLVRKMYYPAYCRAFECRKNVSNPISMEIFILKLKKLYFHQNLELLIEINLICFKLQELLQTS